MPDEREWMMTPCVTGPTVNHTRWRVEPVPRRDECVYEIQGGPNAVTVVPKSRLVVLEAELTQRERERDEYQRRMVDALDSMEAHRANHNEAVERLGRAAAVLALIGTLGDVDADEAPSLARRVLAELESVEAGEKKRNTTTSGADDA